MRARVVILLDAPAGHLSAYFPSRHEAFDYVTAWRDRQVERIANGRDEVETQLLQCGDPCCWAVMAKYVIGMYVAEDEPSTAKAMIEMAEAVKRQASDGEEWRQ